jgi:predicted RNA-binding protein with PIN domain
VTSSDILINVLLDAERRIAETNELIEDQRELIEKLAYEKHDTTSAQIVFDSLCVSLALHVQTRHRLHTKVRHVKAA